MNAAPDLARPGARLGARPERRVEPLPPRLLRPLATRLRRRQDSPRNLASFAPIWQRIGEQAERYRETDLAERKSALQALRRQLRARGLDEPLLIEAFGAMSFAIEQCLGLEVHREQCFAGWSLLHGRFVEMQTGEGKTLTAALPTIVLGLAGVPVHVITANQYLAQRDAVGLSGLYAWFELRSAAVRPDDSDAARRGTYAAAIVYVTHQQLVFDYLRDAHALGERRVGLCADLGDLLGPHRALPLQRGLCFAVVDEADSALIDDARTPLILADATESEAGAGTEAAVALAIAALLQDTQDYKLERDTRQARLTLAGRETIRRHAECLQGAWQLERYRAERICQALVALHLLQRDHDYLVRGDHIELIDGATGRSLPDRRLQHGLHRMLEAKERCTISQDTTPILALSFQQFFGRYHGLAGMSGTLRGATGELRKVYGASTVIVPPARPVRRVVHPSRILPTRDAQLETLLEWISRCRTLGQPVLVGTRSVKCSDRVSERLRTAGIHHELLNARQDEEEARIVATAGQAGAVTVATNMAGRGTDISLGEGVADSGGLLVLNLELNDSRRVDRQLRGRAARQGDPGAYCDLLCLEDELLCATLPGWLLRRTAAWLIVSPLVARPFALLLLRAVQRHTERHHARQRMAIFHGQSELQRSLALDGRRVV